MIDNFDEEKFKEKDLKDLDDICESCRNVIMENFSFYSFSIYIWNRFTVVWHPNFFGIWLSVLLKI